ncbi:kinase-like domain-containing protein [Gigaspora rosea]|uniref:Kinase-like domain-containing protein n=1 Tax=Gigaspora rosea TaxID=44941 RepID=A0A397U3Z1_9GLOM|nr:kinase-like domain-containing protein [Gigaspora rosea]
MEDKSEKTWGFAIVYSAVFDGKTYALKSLNNNLGLNDKEFKQFRRELKLLYTIDNHPNIVKFYGVSRESTGNFMLILQFANNGNLRDYLRNKQIEGVYKISWVELIQIAGDIANGLKHLHDKHIIHRDLHSKNVLLNDGRALITDFGISKHLNDTTTSSSDKGGVPAYIEPQCYLQDGNVKRDQKSDIYSLGVLLWELTSGVPPFNDFPDRAIIIEISQNKREKTIENTPPHYVNLYTNCWSSDPDLRPKLNEVLIELKKLETVEFITNNINNRQIQQPIFHSYDTDSILSINTC